MLEIVSVVVKTLDKPGNVIHGVEMVSVSFVAPSRVLPLIDDGSSNGIEVSFVCVVSDDNEELRTVIVPFGSTDVVMVIGGVWTELIVIFSLFNVPERVELFTTSILGSIEATAIVVMEGDNVCEVIRGM